MTLEYNLKTGAARVNNHNNPTAGLRVKTRVKAGLNGTNHNETQVRDTNSAAGLRVKTRVKAGSITSNHNEAQVRDSNSAEA